uniref:Poly [ADP-ribose] polymerase n=1 Tax=Alexandrium catenella TaxID=2925 RepID=A0A7S1QZS6_ALECA
MRKPRCKYGESCYQTNPEHRNSFLHPGDECWEASSSTTVKDQYMCQCGHKQKLHSSPLLAINMVTYPTAWESDVTSGQEFSQCYQPKEFSLAHFQALLDNTYSDVTTRDRVKSCGTWEVPRNFTVVEVARNENSRLWRKYKMKKHELLKEARLFGGAESSDQAQPSTLPEFGDHGDIATSRVVAGLAEEFKKRSAELGREVSEDDGIEPKINEWVLFHGTSASAARNICARDFTMRLAGSATGTLYGRGTYLAESITKADEYAREEDGVFTVLLCRVLGGRVKYCDERTPDADGLMAECTEGVYDCILGDRFKCSGTYREFVVFDTENVYPEYVIKYTRGEFFKSPSHP